MQGAQYLVDARPVTVSEETVKVASASNDKAHTTGVLEK